MSENVKFVRINGRIVPIRKRIAEGVSTGAVAGALTTGAVWTGLTKVNKSFSVPGTFFWASKGALLGAGIGGAVALAGNKGRTISEEGKTRAKVALGTSLGLAALGQGLRISAPFVGRKHSMAGNLMKLGAFGATVGMAFSPALQAALARPDDRGMVLAAGALGSVAGTNLGRFGAPIIKHSKKLGMR